MSEATKIKLHPDNTNREEGLSLRKLRKKLLQNMDERKKESPLL
jgi:hypothetical protein